jgi:AraC-like DNA-binding protein
LAELARLCGLNEFKLKKGYKEAFGATVFGHFNSMRMKQALLLLRNTDRSITEIAYETGYAHSQHFNRAFKKEFGISPGEARRSGMPAGH